MLLKLLGSFDIIAGLILIFGIGMDFPWQFLWVVGFLLLIKAGFGMLRDFASWIDLFCGIIFLLRIVFDIYSIIGLIFGILLIQKGVVSFL